MYSFYNANPKKHYIDDCTIRAISVAEDLSWNDAFYKMSNLARKQGVMMDNVDFIEKYLNSMYNRECTHSVSVGEFVEEHPRGVYLITMPNHITVCVNGCIFDTFDCTDRVMKCAWRVK